MLTDPNGLQQQNLPRIVVNPLSFVTKAPKQTGKAVVNGHFPTKDKEGFDVYLGSSVKFNPSIDSRDEKSNNLVGGGTVVTLTWKGASDLKGGFVAFLKNIGPGEKYSIEMEMSLEFRTKNLTDPLRPPVFPKSVVFKKRPSFIKDEINNRELSISTSRFRLAYPPVKRSLKTSSVVWNKNKKKSTKIKIATFMPMLKDLQTGSVPKTYSYGSEDSLTGKITKRMRDPEFLVDAEIYLHITYLGKGFEKVGFGECGVPPDALFA